MPRAMIPIEGLLLAAAVLLLLVPAPADADHRIRTVCGDLGGEVVSCGGDGQIHCDPDEGGSNGGPVCDAGLNSYRHDPFDRIYVNCPFPVPNENFGVCYACGGDGDPACGPDPLVVPFARYCDPGLVVAPTSELSGSLSACSPLFPDLNLDDAGAVINETAPGLLYEDPGFTNALTSSDIPEDWEVATDTSICADAAPIDFSAGSRETWIDATPPSDDRGTIFVIHGRASSCNIHLDHALSESIYDRNQLVYCVEYDPQTGGDSSTAGSGRDVKILPVLQDSTGEGPSTCVGPWPSASPAPPGSCGFDRDNPVATVRADALSVEGLADALANAMREVPIEGEITLLPYSQGGFLARALLHRHYDDLRWHGRKISHVITLGHPYLGVLTDPSLVAPWSCFGFSASYKNCHVPRWLWGWQESLNGGSGYTIDDGEFPQIQWSAIAGHETGNDHSATFNFPEACIGVFGGVVNAQTDGDGTVPIKSSLGVDEHDFYPFTALDFDAAIETPCGHEPYCQLANAVTSLGDGLLPRAAARESHGTLTFAGNQQVAVTDPAALSALTATNAFSLEAWVRPTDDSQSVAILSKGGEYRLEYADNRSFRITMNGFWGSDFVGFGSDIPLHAWTHVAVTHANGVLRGYVNGELAVEETGGPLVDDDPAQQEFRIGGTEDGSIAAMVGSIDDVRVWTKELTQAEIRAGIGGFDVRQLNATGLRAWWKFDEPDGDTLIDSKLVGTTFYHASLLDFPSAPWRWGPAREVEDGALYFDGKGDRVFFQDPVSMAALTMTDGLTLEAWINPRDDEPGVIFHKAGEYQLRRRFDGTLSYWLASASPGYTERLTGAAIPSRTWTHVALTFGGSAAAIFVNGERVFLESTTGPLGDIDPVRDQLSIGGPVLATLPPSSFNGLIDEVRIWDRARSIPQIRNGLFRVIEPSDPTTQGLVGSWRFNEQSTELVLDAVADRHGRRGQLFIDPADNTEKPVRATNKTVPEPTLALGIAIGGLLIATRARRSRRASRDHA